MIAFGNEDPSASEYFKKKKFTRRIDKSWIELSYSTSCSNAAGFKMRKNGVFFLLAEVVGTQEVRLIDVDGRSRQCSIFGLDEGI